ncbi:hypothetical protein [Bacillus cereus]|uniref:hypothetical protein n=1 Tax=Bacillus cereus TaxID=1396 RepID=UPI0014829B44|nr:hypothetical protein [Bacillus cereus]
MKGIDIILQNGMKFSGPIVEITDTFIDVYTVKVDMKWTTFYKLVQEYEMKQANW